MNRCQICDDLAVNTNVTLCLTCWESAERGKVIYDPQAGWYIRELLLHCPMCDRERRLMREPNSRIPLNVARIESLCPWCCDNDSIARESWVDAAGRRVAHE